jgi:hypothetical protein
VLSNQIHDQRRVTKNNVMILIDYAADKIGKTIDQRLGVAKDKLSLRACQIFCVERGHEINPKGLFHDRRNDHKEAQGNRKPRTCSRSS